MTVFRWLNNNIGCIEIISLKITLITSVRLNNNMGCIEIATGNWLYDLTKELNNNIGCIEIIYEHLGFYFTEG